MVSWVIVKLPHQTSPKGDHIPHEQKYNTRHGLSAIPNEVHREIRRQPRQPEVQQEPVVHLFLEAALGWKCGSLACQSRRPHSHPNQHTEAELKLIRDMRRRNPPLVWSNSGTVCGSAATPAARKVCSVSCVKWGCFLPKSRKIHINQSLMSR